MIKHILFDFDNTLSMTEYSNFLAENEAARRLGYRLQSREIHKNTVGVEFREALKIRFPEADADLLMKVISKEIFPEYLEKDIADKISNSTYNSLEQLKNRDLKLHILTSRRKDVVNHLLDENHRLNKYITRFFYLEKTKFSKPDPRTFQIPLMQLNCNPSECLYVGDAPDDQCAKDAGLKLAITLESDLRKKEDFDKNKVDWFIDSIEGLLDIAQL
jgi:HAD superfamily hydrolase (TIGR01549 family)